MTQRDAYVHFWFPGLLAGIGIGMVLMLAALGYLW